MGPSKERQGCNFTPSVIIHGQIPFNFFKFVILEFANNKIVKIGKKTKIRMLNVKIRVLNGVRNFI